MKDLRIKMSDAEDWGDEYATWPLKVYDEQDRRDLAEMLLDPVTAMAHIPCCAPVRADMSDIEFIKRLPASIIHCSNGGFVEMCRTTQTGVFAIDTGDPYCDPRMSWES